MFNIPLFPFLLELNNISAFNSKEIEKYLLIKGIIKFLLFIYFIN